MSPRVARLAETMTVCCRFHGLPGVHHRFQRMHDFAGDGISVIDRF